MGYTFIATEKTTASGNEAETRALLRLMCSSDHRDDIEQFAIDCFNDVTGMDNPCMTLHDVQSKAGKNVTPSELGKDLATLFENSVSEFSQYFATLTLVVGGVSPTVLDGREIEEFGFRDIAPKAQKRVRDHLISECSRRKNGLTDESLCDENVDDFLSKVRIVIAKQGKAEYIEPLVRTSSTIYPDRRKLERIFNEIRDMQSKLKNRAGIAGKTISRPDAVTDYGRILRRKEIELLVIERLLNRDFMKEDTPPAFRDYLAQRPPEDDDDDFAEECRNQLCLQYFDKHNRDAFWQLLDEIVTILETSSDTGLESVYDQISDDVRRKCTHLSKPSHLYFIATVKDGLRK